MRIELATPAIKPAMDILKLTLENDTVSGERIKNGKSTGEGWIILTFNEDNTIDINRAGLKALGLKPGKTIGIKI